MASFEEHVEKAKHNLGFLGEVIGVASGFEDWNITILYYVSVHLINAHIAKTADAHYKSHREIANAIDYTNMLSPCKLTMELCFHYAELEKYSRRARYMLEFSDPSKAAYVTTKHLQKAIGHTDKLMEYFSKTYAIDDFPVITMNLEGLTDKRYFN